LTLTVQDMNAARSEIEKALAELGGRIIKVEPLESKILLTAELSSNRLETLLNKLKSLGEVKGGVAGLEAKEGAITVVGIEILGARPNGN
jgi:nitrate reductase NapAB chaperone NapD